MQETPAPQKPHSVEYFGDYRDFWWNRDFLNLMAKRLDLSEIRNALEFPPYETREQKVHLDQSLEWNDREFWTRDKEETWKYFSAGGGLKDEFDHLWKVATQDDGSFKNALLKRTYHSAGGSDVFGFRAKDLT